GAARPCPGQHVDDKSGCHCDRDRHPYVLLSYGNAVMHRMMARICRLLPAAALMAATWVVGSPATARAQHGSGQLVTVTLDAIGRDGRAAVIGSQGIAVPLNAGAAVTQYRASTSGVLQLPAGRYLLLVSVLGATSATDSANSQTLAARVVMVTNSQTVTFDAREGRPLSVGLSGVAATQLTATAQICAVAADGAEGAVAADGLAAAGHTSLFSVPFKYRGVSLGYAATWRGQRGTRYVTAGVHRAGLPTGTRFTFQARRLTRLTLEVKSGVAAGNTASWVVRLSSGQPYSGCYVGPISSNGPVRVPSRPALCVSAGPWMLSYWPQDGTGDSLTQANVIIPPTRRRFVQVFGGAVAGPVTAPAFVRYGHPHDNLRVPTDFFGG